MVQLCTFLLYLNVLFGGNVQLLLLHFVVRAFAVIRSRVRARPIASH